LVLEDLTEVPSETKAKNIIQGINEKCEANDTRWMNHQLYQVLCLKLEGKALKMVKNLHKQIDINGVIGWCKLLQDCSSMTSQRMQGLASKVYSPKRIKSYADVNAAIEEWETNAELFSTFETHPISMITKIFAIRQIVPAELEADIIRSTSLDTYDKMRAYVCEQVAMRRDVKNASKGPVALDLNMAESMWSKMMGEKESENETDESNEYGNEECEKCEGGTMMEQLFSFVKGQKGGKGGKGGKGKGKAAGDPQPYNMECIGSDDMCWMNTKMANVSLRNVLPWQTCHMMQRDFALRVAMASDCNCKGSSMKTPLLDHAPSYARK